MQLWGSIMRTYTQTRGLLDGRKQVIDYDADTGAIVGCKVVDTRQKSSGKWSSLIDVLLLPIKLFEIGYNWGARRRR